jgi:hypothetical protein
MMHIIIFSYIHVYPAVLFSERKQNSITGEKGNSFIFTFFGYFEYVHLYKIAFCFLNSEQLHGIMY